MCKIEMIDPYIEIFELKVTKKILYRKLAIKRNTTTKDTQKERLTQREKVTQKKTTTMKIIRNTQKAEEVRK
jgi:hypothetical protein